MGFGVHLVIRSNNIIALPGHASPELCRFTTVTLHVTAVTGSVLVNNFYSGDEDDDKLLPLHKLNEKRSFGCSTQ